MFMIPIVAIVFGVSAGMLGVWANHLRKRQMLDQWHKERMAAMDKGIPLPGIPANLLGELDTPSALRSLRSGISLVLVGIIVYVATAESIDESLALFGLIPSAVGVANLLYAALLWRRNRAAPPNT